MRGPISISTSRDAFRGLGLHGWGRAWSSRCLMFSGGVNDASIPRGLRDA